MTSMHSSSLLILCIVLFISPHAPGQSSKLPVTSGPRLFEEGVVSTQLSERDMAISPDGKDMLYTVQLRAAGFQTIVHRSRLSDGRWSEPKVAWFAGQYSDLEPAFSPDGKRLFFCSNRPLDGQEPKDYDIWVMEKKEGGWSEPQNIGAPVNTDKDEFFPSITQNGNLYFTATRKNGIGREDIFIARWENNRYAEPEPLDSAINSAAYEFNAFVSPDEQFILFTSYGRADEKGGGDLYISMKDANGRWTKAKNCVMVNSDKLDYSPFISFDKKTLYFTSERHNLSSSFPGKPVTYSQLQQIASSALNGGGNIFSIAFSEVLQSVENK